MDIASTLSHRDRGVADVQALPVPTQTIPASARQGRGARAGTASLAVDPALPSFAYRRAYASLVLPDVAPPTIAVTSAVRGEGRTTVSLGLARTVAHDGETRVVLVEVDLERPSLAVRLSLQPGPGLADVLMGRATLRNALVLVEENLWVLPAGDAGDRVPRLLRQIANGALTIKADSADVVILDLPPVMTDAYAPLIATATGAILLVVRGAATPYKVVRAAVERFDGARPQGIVLNAPRTALPRWWPGRGI